LVSFIDIAPLCSTKEHVYSRFLVRLKVFGHIPGQAHLGVVNDEVNLFQSCKCCNSMPFKFQTVGIKKGQV
jgi:hypothetical protein